METLIDAALLLLAKGAKAIQARVKAAQQRDLERMQAQAKVDEEREARRGGREP